MLMLALCGFLIGGSFSWFKQGHKAGGFVLAVAAALSAAAAIVWWD